jgi:hypothetical protein
MKNYVVWTNCQIQDPQREFGLEAPNYKNYDRMCEISLASARKFLGGAWQSKIFTDPAASRTAMFQQNWQRIWDLWHSEPCNILYLDSDTVITRATDIFGRFPEFRLFNWSTPKSKPGYPNYFNAGVRYYPATMSKEIWAAAAETAKNWDLTIWDQEQLIFNSMFWSQDLSWEDAHRPELNWQCPVVGQKIDLVEYNGIPPEAAHIIHYHGTRSSETAVKFAEDIAQRVGINL